MDATEIRSITVNHCTDAAKAEFGLAMLQEIAAQLAELNERLSQRPTLTELPEFAPVAETAKDLLGAIRSGYGSIVPYLYPQAPVLAPIL